MFVTVKFIGFLRHASGKDNAQLECAESTTLQELLNQVIAGNPALKRSLLDENLQGTAPNALMLVNGKEISVLDGLETKLSDGDEVAFIPVVHGG